MSEIGSVVRDLEISRAWLVDPVAGREGPGELVVTAPDAPADVMINLQPMNIVQAAADLLFSPVFRRFPDVTVALSEGGIGWVPYFLERVDHTFDTHHAWTLADFGGRKPSEVFLERVMLCFIEDDFGARHAREIGTDRICVETDYPRIMKIVLDAGYHGHVGIEYEGDKLSEAQGIRATKLLLDRIREGVL